MLQTDVVHHPAKPSALRALNQTLLFKGAMIHFNPPRSAELERLGNRALHQAQEENRQRGIPNWYSINGQLVSDAELKKD